MRTRLSVLVIAPVAVFTLLALAGLTFIQWLALMAAFGHGELTREESIPYYVVFGVIALAGATGTIPLVERWTLGRKGERTAGQAAVTRRTRPASAVLIVIVMVGGLPLMREIGFRSTAAKARDHGADAYSERWGSIRDLMLIGTPRAFDVLREIAFDGGDNPYARQTAVGFMADFPESKPLLLMLVQDPVPEVRAAAGVTLQRFSSDPEAFAAIEQLTKDPVPNVREQVLNSFKVSGSTSPRPEQRTELLNKLSTSERPDEVLSAARGLGSAGYDAALAIIMDPNQLGGTRIEAIKTLGQLKNDRAIELLRAIVTERAEPGLIPPTRETAFRNAAQEALGKLVSSESNEWVAAYWYEQRTLDEIKKVVAAQEKYAEATGFFDSRLTCLEQPANCVPGRDRDELLLGPALVSQLPRLGYTRRFLPGPAVSSVDITARKASASSITSFAYVAAPEVPFETGIRAFCADDTGQICFTRDGKAPPTKNGRCPESVPAEPGEYYFPDSADAPRECKLR